MLIDYQAIKDELEKFRKCGDDYKQIDSIVCEIKNSVAKVTISKKEDKKRG